MISPLLHTQLCVTHVSSFLACSHFPPGQDKIRMDETRRLAALHPNLCRGSVAPPRGRPPFTPASRVASSVSGAKRRASASWETMAEQTVPRFFRRLKNPHGCPGSRCQVPTRSASVLEWLADAYAFVLRWAGRSVVNRVSLTLEACAWGSVDPSSSEGALTLCTPHEGSRFVPAMTNLSEVRVDRNGGGRQSRRGSLPPHPRAPLPRGPRAAVLRRCPDAASPEAAPRLPVGQGLRLLVPLMMMLLPLVTGQVVTTLDAPTIWDARGVAIEPGGTYALVVSGA